ncbi:MAG: hypothetical protein QNJ51_26910 [Calothrix sp. MO_167.B12]|nr:hypothetical protein [Calothrix sp. MO_167.B12]
MAIIKQTTNKLTLIFFPWFIWIMTGLSLITLPIFFTIILQPIPKNITCERVKGKQINCQLRTLLLPFLPSEIVKIEDLKSVHINTISDAYNRTKTQQVVLLAKNREVILLAYKSYQPKYTAPADILIAQSRINAFINNPKQQSFQLETGYTLFQWLFILAIAIEIGYIIFMSESSICEFDRSSGYMTKKQRWLFIFTKTTKHQLFNIQDVQVEWTYHKSKVYRLTLSLASGEKLSLSTYYANYLKSGKKIEAAADMLRDFLSLPKTSK